MFRRVLVRSFSTPAKGAWSKNWCKLPEAHVADTPKQYYESLSKKNREGKLLARRDLRHVLLRSKEANDWTYAYKTYNLFHALNIEFNEEICSNLVSLAIAHNQTEKLADNMSTIKCRLTPWMGKKVLTSFVEALLAKQDFTRIANMLWAVNWRKMDSICDPEMLAKVKEAATALNEPEKHSELFKSIQAVSPK